MLKIYSNNRFERGSAHIWIIVILVAIILGLLGTVLWQQLTKPSSSADSSKDSQTSSSPYQSYTSSDAGTYAKSFEYPADWQVSVGEEVCTKYGLCASPPAFIIVDENNAIKVAFSSPQSASETSIDDEASNLATSDGTIAKDFTSLDGIEARKITQPNGDVIVIATLRGGYGEITFTQVDSQVIDTILSTWKWS